MKGYLILREEAVLEDPQNNRRKPSSSDLFTETQAMRPVRRRSRGHGRLSDKLGHVSGITVVMIGVGAVVFVIALLVGLIAVVLQYSGQTVSVAPTPTLLIEFATPVAGATQLPVRRATPTLPTVPTVVAAAGAVAAPPPDVDQGPISAGGYAEVQGTGTLGVRLRTGPGLNYTTNKVADEGTRFKVLEGPQQADEFQWWRLQTQDGTIGWAAGTYLRPVDGFD